MNKVLLVGRLTRDPDLRSLPSGKHVAQFTIATNEYRSGGQERTEYHPCVAWDRLAEITGQFLSKGQLVDIEGRLQTRQWDDDAGRRYCIVVPYTAERVPPMTTTVRCPECGRVFDLTNEDDAAEWYYGHDCEEAEED